MKTRELKGSTPTPKVSKTRLLFKPRPQQIIIELKKGDDLVSGFTLIELLVTIAIIGLLASVVLVSVNNARVKARDAKRKMDIAQIQKALELYYDDNQRYPPAGGAIAPNGGWTNSNDSSWDTFGTALQKYISKLPHDPKETPSAAGNTGLWAASGGVYTYSYLNMPTCDTLQGYMIVYQLEKAGSPSPGVMPCNQPAGTNGSCANDGMYRYGDCDPSAIDAVQTVGVGKRN